MTAEAEAGPVDGALSAPPSSAVGRAVRQLEHGFLIVALLAAAFLPLADTLGRPFGLHVPAGADYLQQVVLWLAFLGGLRRDPRAAPPVALDRRALRRGPGPHGGPRARRRRLGRDRRRS